MKRFIGILMAAVMVFGTVTAFAGEATPEGNPSPGNITIVLDEDSTEIATDNEAFTQAERDILTADTSRLVLESAGNTDEAVEDFVDELVDNLASTQDPGSAVNPEELKQTLVKVITSLNVLKAAVSAETTAEGTTAEGTTTGEATSTEAVKIMTVTEVVEAFAAVFGRVLPWKIAEEPEGTEETEETEEPEELVVLKVYDSDGNEAARKSVRTASAPRKLSASADRTLIRADGEDLSYITVSVLDAHGVSVPDADMPVKIKVRGKAVRFRAAANGDPTCIEPFHEPLMHLFSGKLTVIVQSSGKAGESTVILKSKGLKRCKIRIGAE